MKFTKEEAFENIKSKLTEKGKKLFMSERSINEQLETLMPLVASEEMELGDFVDKVYKSFETMNLNANNDQSTFVKAWKEEHPDTKPNAQAQQAPQSPQLSSAEENNRKEFEELKQQIQQLVNERETARKESAVANKRKELQAAMKSKGIKDEQWIADYANEILITEDIDIEAKADSALKIYNRVNAATGNPATPHASASSGKVHDNRLNEVEALLKVRREERESINNN